MKNVEQIEQYKDQLLQVGALARQLSQKLEELIIMRDAPWHLEDIDEVKGIAKYGGSGLNRLYKSLEKLNYTQAENYRAMRQNK